MTFDLSTMLNPAVDQTDNPYMPRNQQNIRLALDPSDPAYLPPFPAFPHAATRTMLADGPMVNEGETVYDDMDDSSSEILVPLEEYEFPTYFRVTGEPPRLFHSHGISSYALPVDTDETKVCFKQCVRGPNPL